MNSFIYSYTIASTANNVVNIDKLHIEVKATPINTYISSSVVGGKILIEFSEELIEATGYKLLLDQTIAAHDGEPPAITATKRKAREEMIDEMAQMAVYTPLVAADDTVGYLTHIDNYINAYIRLGNNIKLLGKIAQDAQDTGHEYYVYLNSDVNDDGVKAFQYFIGTIQAFTI